MMKKEWLEALGRMTYGIYVLTTRVGDTINGMIASWVSQVSYAPPLIMVAIHPNRYSHNLVEEGPSLALHIIDREQREMLKIFKGPDPAMKFSGIPWGPGQTGVPILENCLAWLELMVKERHTPGNHTLFICEIIAGGSRSSGIPLCTLDYEGMYVGKD
jgi:flavin reductase (DIM6/NTAB) family NADH-FMN oxidoreductase RutF